MLDDPQDDLPRQIEHLPGLAVPEPLAAAEILTATFARPRPVLHLIIGHIYPLKMSAFVPLLAARFAARAFAKATVLLALLARRRLAIAVLRKAALNCYASSDQDAHAAHRPTTRSSVISLSPSFWLLANISAL